VFDRYTVIRVARETEVYVVRCSAGCRSSASAMPVWNSVRSRVRRVPISPGASSDNASTATKHLTLQVR